MRVPKEETEQAVAILKRNGRVVEARYLPDIGHGFNKRENAIDARFTSLPNAAENERLDLTHRQVLQLIRDKPFDFEPGSSWRYDNSGYYLAGMIVESVTGQDYGNYLRERVFEPLGMTSALLCNAGMLVPHLASGYEADHGRLRPAALMSWTLPFAAGAVCATATDLLKWEIALDEGQLLSRQSRALMRSPTALWDGTSIDYGLGLRLGAFEGRKVFGHTGGGGGFTTVLESFPDERLTIAVLINTASGPATSVAGAIARAIFGKTRPQLRDLPVPEDELGALPGKYDSDEGPVEIFSEAGKIYFRVLGAQQSTGRLRRQSRFIYAIDTDHVVRFLVRRGLSQWALVLLCYKLLSLLNFLAAAGYSLDEWLLSERRFRRSGTFTNWSKRPW